MTDRRLLIAALGLAALIVAKVALNVVANPLDTIREDLATALDEVPSNAPLLDDGRADFARWMQDIEAVPSLWQELVAPSEPPAPPPPPKPKAPSLAKMLATVSIGKGQIGMTKIKVFTPQSPRGRWLQVGAEINGCTLESFTREEAIFSYYWEEGGQVLEVAMARE